MKNNTPRKTINVDIPNLMPLWTLKQEDNVVLNLSLFKESIPFNITGQSIRLGAKTNAGLKEQVDGFTIQGNNLDIALKNTILVPGLIEIDLEFTDAGGKMTSASFFINVNSKVLNNTAVKATNEFDTFTKTVEEIQEDYQGLRKIVIAENAAADLQDQVNTTNASLEQIENKKAEKATTQSLQAQINSLAIGSGTSSAEVVQARVSPNGSTFQTVFEKNSNTDRAVELIIDKMVDEENKITIKSPIIAYNKVGYRFNDDGSEMVDSEWRISDYIKIDRKLFLTAYAYDRRVAITVYDNNLKIVKTINNTIANSQINKIEVTLSPIDGAFVRMTSYKEYENYLASYYYYKELKEKTIELEEKAIELEESCKSFAEIEEDKLLFKRGYRIGENGEDVADGQWWVISDYIEVDRNLEVVGGSATQYQVAMALYDSDKQLIKTYKGDTKQPNSNGYYKKINITPLDCKFVRVSSNIDSGYLTMANITLKKSAIEFIADVEENISGIKENIIDIEENIKNIAGKNPYTPNTIFFSVSINQNFSDSISISNTVNDSENFKEVYCALRLPTNYQATGKACKIAVVMHGAGGKVTSSSAGEMNGFTDLLDNGYAIFDVNGSNNDYTVHSDHMGSPRALSAYLKAFEWIKQNYNVEDKLYVHGHSMGGLTALNFAIQNPSICKVLGLYHPVVDLYNQAWLKPWFGGADGTKFAIAREYNFDDKTGNTFEKEKIIGFNPIENNSVLVGEKRYNTLPCPIKIWHGNADNVVSLSGTQSYIQALKNGGVRCELRIEDGVGHSHSNAMYKELTMWFNRF